VTVSQRPFNVMTRSTIGRPPAVQSPNQHDTDLAAAGGDEYILPEFAFARAGADFDLTRNRPAALRANAMA
jgi:hypothetical protein